MKHFHIPFWWNSVVRKTVSWNWKRWLKSVMKCIVSCDWPRAPLVALYCTLCFMHTGLELYVCLTPCTSLSSSQQHLVIWGLEINTVIMCGTLFILSQCNVFSTLNQFCHSADTSLGLSHCVVHIRGGFAGSPGPAALCHIWMMPPVSPSSLFSLSAQCFHRRRLTQRTLPLTGWSWQVRGQVKWNWQREGSGERKEYNTGKGDGGEGRLRPQWKGAQY